MAVFRFYAHTLSDIYEILPYAYACPDYNDIQIVLCFARDYDKEGKYTTGEFFPDFDTSSITPKDIRDIKSDALRSIKFFLSIGGRDPRYPFRGKSPHNVCPIWIDNATKSLTKIVKDYHIDGIDVYYEHINSGEGHPCFLESIPEVIKNLRGGRNPIVTQASITVSDPLFDIYVKLYEKCPNLIDIVVYQCFTLPGPIPIPTSQALVDVFNNKLFPHFPKKKILAGYSDWPCDKKIVKPAIFVVALAMLLSEGILGFSMWHGNPVP